MAITIPNTFADKTGQVQLEALDENFSQIATDLDAEVVNIQNQVDASLDQLDTSLNEIQAVVDSIEDPVAMSLLFGPDPTPEFTNDLYYRLNTAYTPGAYAATNSIFGAGVTLNANTIYDFDLVMVLTKTVGATSHTLGLAFGGTATLNNILYRGEGIADNAALPVARINTTQTTFTSNSASTLVITGAIAVAGHYSNFRVSGSISVNAGGTFIPQYVLSANPGGLYTTNIGSYIRLREIGQAGSNSSSGVWA